MSSRHRLRRGEAEVDSEPRPASPAPLPEVASILAVQRSAGNRAVARLMYNPKNSRLVVPDTYGKQRVPWENKQLRAAAKATDDTIQYDDSSTRFAVMDEWGYKPIFVGKTSWKDLPKHVALKPGVKYIFDIEGHTVAVTASKAVAKDGKVLANAQSSLSTDSHPKNYKPGTEYQKDVTSISSSAEVADDEPFIRRKADVRPQSRTAAVPRVQLFRVLSSSRSWRPIAVGLAGVASYARTAVMPASAGRAVPVM